MSTQTLTATAPALTEKALLVTLNICQWSARKFDKKATDEVNHNHGSTDAGRFNKALVSRDHLQEIGKLANEARTFHYENTLPWGDNGERLLPSSNYFEYTQALAVFKNKFDGLVREFCKSYPLMIDEARRRLNGLFEERDYPANVADKFQVKTMFMPVPESADFRLNLNAQEVESLRGKIEDEIGRRFAAAQHDIYVRIADQLKRMHERLKDTEAVFRNTLFENLRELCDLLPRLNLANDPQITALTQELKQVYTDPDAVRKDTRLRADKAAQVEDILTRMGGFLK